jgi:hypothetical protein
MKNKKILYGFKHETLTAKIKWMLSLSVAERYETNIGLADFLRAARKNRAYLNAQRPFKTIQVLKRK